MHRAFVLHLTMTKVGKCMNNLFFIISVLMVSLVTKAEVFQGQIENAVGSAHHFNGAPCVVKVIATENKSIYAIIEVSPVTAEQKTIKLLAVLTKSDRYLVEKALGYDYASHKMTQEKFIQTDISNLLKIDQTRAVLTQEYKRRDTSLLYAKSQYYKFTCVGQSVK